MAQRFRFGLGRSEGQGCGCGCGGRGAKLQVGPPQACVCSSCGRETPHKPGDPCREGKCPHCGGEMVRKG